MSVLPDISNERTNMNTEWATQTAKTIEMLEEECARAEIKTDLFFDEFDSVVIGEEE